MWVSGQLFSNNQRALGGVNRWWQGWEGCKRRGSKTPDDGGSTACELGGGGVLEGG